MSAFIVGHDHIDALMSYASFKRISFYHPEAQTRTTITTFNAEEIGRILLHENERSVRYRYDTMDPDELPGTIGEDAASYRFRLYAKPMNAVQTIKAVNCLEYQSCEHPDWEASLAWRICQDIKAHAVHDLPGYDKADWEIRRNAEPAETVIDPDDFNNVASRHHY